VDYRERLEVVLFKLRQSEKKTGAVNSPVNSPTLNLKCFLLRAITYLTHRSDFTYFSTIDTLSVDNIS